MKKENQGLKQPFFASLLESQLSEKNSGQLKGGVTKKYPSDAAEGVTKPALDLLQTQKFPSDSDEE